MAGSSPRRTAQARPLTRRKTDQADRIGNRADAVGLIEKCKTMRLADVDAEIADLQGQIEELRTVRELVEALQGKVPPGRATGQARPGTNATSPTHRATGFGPAPSGVGHKRKLAMAKYIIDKGPQRMTDLGKAINCPPTQFAYLLNGPWFCRTGYGTYGLTNMGREQATHLLNLPTPAGSPTISGSSARTT